MNNTEDDKNNKIPLTSQQFLNYYEQGFNVYLQLLAAAGAKLDEKTLIKRKERWMKKSMADLPPSPEEA